MADETKRLPLMHISININALPRVDKNHADQLIKLVEYLRGRYRGKYEIVIAPKGTMDARSEDCNVVVLPLHEPETIKNLFKILDDETWRVEDKKDDPS